MDERVEFNKLKADVKNIELDVTRIDDDNYFEAVIKKGCLGDVSRVLESVFGPPVWPSRAKLSKEAEELIKGFGGLRKGQTLYFSDKDDRSVFAMLWPWQDGERITVKIARA